MNQEQFDKVRRGQGFIAALDQSGGSTPKALKLYGIDETQYSNEDEMFDLVHEMRTRIMTSPAFGGDRVLGAILFEQTMDRQVEGKDTGDYLWGVKGVVPFIKIDKGLADEADGVQVMKPMPGLDELLDRSAQKGMFGTKERSFIKRADKGGIGAVVDQQFEVARRVLDKGLVPIVEPEVDIKSPSKAEAEALLGHPNVLKVVALSGGYTRAEACAELARNTGVVASFSRALTEGLTAQQSDDEFDRVLDQSIQAIYEASVK